MGVYQHITNKMVVRTAMLGRTDFSEQQFGKDFGNGHNQIYPIKKKNSLACSICSAQPPSLI